MLDGNVQIMTDLRISRDGLHQCLINLLRVAVEDADPLQSLQGRQFIQKLRQRLVSVEVCPVQCGFLGHQDQLPGTILHQRRRLCQKTLHGHGTIMSPQLRNDAVGAVLVTALCNLQILGIALAAFHALQLPVQLLHILTDADDLIHLRQLLPDFIPVALHETAGHDQLLELGTFLILTHLDDGIDALLLRRSDEGAGVDDGQIRLLRVVRDLGAGILLQQTAEQLF